MSKDKKGIKLNIPNHLLMAAGKHAAERGMTLEEYIEEFIGILQSEQDKGNLELDSKSIQDKISTYSKL
jgi:predicted DNA binding CopG/RHH family protein